MTTITAGWNGRMVVMAVRTELRTGIGSVELSPDRRPGEAHGISRSVAINTCGVHIVCVCMAVAARSGACRPIMPAGHKIGHNGGIIMAGDAEIGTRSNVIERFPVDGP